VNKWNNIFIQIAVADVRLTSFAATPESVFLRTTFVIATLTASLELSHRFNYKLSCVVALFSFNSSTKFFNYGIFQCQNANRKVLVLSWYIMY